MIRENLKDSEEYKKAEELEWLRRQSVIEKEVRLMQCRTSHTLQLLLFSFLKQFLFPRPPKPVKIRRRKNWKKCSSAEFKN